MFEELLNEENRDKLLDYFSIEQKQFRFRRILNAIIFIFIGLLLLYMTSKGGFYYALLPFVGIAGYKYPYFKIILRQMEVLRKNKAMFSEFVETFLALSQSSGNVYNCLQACVEYTDMPLRFGLERLIKRLSVESLDNREAYLEFGRYIGSSEAIVIIDIIYQFDQLGKNKRILKELESYSNELMQNTIEEVIEVKSNSMESLGILPLLGGIFLSFSFVLVIIYYYFDTFMKTAFN